MIEITVCNTYSLTYNAYIYILAIASYQHRLWMRASVSHTGDAIACRKFFLFVKIDSATLEAAGLHSVAWRGCVSAAFDRFLYDPNNIESDDRLYGKHTHTHTIFYQFCFVVARCQSKWERESNSHPFYPNNNKSMPPMLMAIRGLLNLYRSDEGDPRHTAQQVASIRWAFAQMNIIWTDKRMRRVKMNAKKKWKERERMKK